MREHDDALLTTAIEAIKADAPGLSQIADSAQRVAGRLGFEGMSEGMDNYANIIANCGDVQQLIPSYKAGSLSAARLLLVEAHLHDCRACKRRFQSGSETTALDWSAPKASRNVAWRPRALGWALVPCLAVLLAAFFVYKAYWQISPGVRAEVISIDGSAYRLTDSGGGPLAAGDRLQEGEHIRTAGGAHAVLRLADGSTVELNERSVVGVGARGHNMTVALDNGAAIVQAAKRTSGHLYVKTPDCRVAVTGTLFSVNAGIKGSRVAVLQGTVKVMHSGVDSVLHAGEQIATTENLGSAPMEQQIAWSHDREKYLPLLAALALLEHRIGDIALPQPRYSSDLLQRVPTGTLMYISIPNIGNFLSEANTIFHDQLSQSPELQQWWSHGRSGNTEQLDALIAKLHDMSQYLGDEIVIVGMKQADHPGTAIIADVEKGGLGDLLKQQFPSNTAGGLTVLNEQELNAAPISEKTIKGGYALIREHEAVFSNNIFTLKQLNAQLNAGASGFADGDFGKQITAAYGRGAGVILAADLHQIMSERANVIRGQKNGKHELEMSGMDGVQYLIAEHRESNGVPENHLNLQFSGTRQRVASWLASPAPMGSLDFVTPNAAIAVAVLSKDPKEIADDLMAMAQQDDGAPNKGWSEAESKLQISLRDDLAANLGGDFLVSLDGPVLPTPSWKAVIEVHDSQRLEQTLERLTEAIRNQVHGEGAHDIAIESSEVGTQRFYSVHDRTSGRIIAHYTFAEGFMVVGPSRALLMAALRTQASGNSLSRSAAFKNLLPKDANENYSAIAYQNLSPVLTPLLSQLSGQTADAIRKLAADSRPTATCAWGRDSRIEAASDSRLFGFDFLTLGAVLNSRNKLTGQSVRD
jgi:FecR protein/Putative zinc-finger